MVVVSLGGTPFAIVMFKYNVNAQVGQDYARPDLSNVFGKLNVVRCPITNRPQNMQICIEDTSYRAKDMDVTSKKNDRKRGAGYDLNIPDNET